MGRCPIGIVPGGFQKRRPTQGAPNRPSKRNRPGNRNPLKLRRQSIAELDFEAIEMAAGRQTLRLAARALEQRLNTHTSDHLGPQLPCRCGGSAQCHGRQEKTFESVLGPLHLQPCNALTIHCAMSCGQVAWSLQLYIGVHEYSKWLDGVP
jgi:hypothetical protein